MILNDFLLLIADTTRSKAYLQILNKKNYIPKRAIVLCNDIKQMNFEKNHYEGISSMAEQYFDLKESILITLEKMGTQYEIVLENTVNSNSILNRIRKYSEKYIIYSGYGGDILQGALFTLNKKFLHIHAGKLPNYRGSTTAYYSMLKEGHIGATAIFLEEKIDAGAVVATAEYPLPKEKVDIDYIYEPYVRSLVLISAIEKYLEKGEFHTYIQNKSEVETYYIIHPVLKHLAMLSIYDEKEE